MQLRRRKPARDSLIVAQLALYGLLLHLAGCSAVLTLPPAESQSFLRPVETAPDSVALEIFQVRVPADDPELTEDLWRTIDEQRLDVENRRSLASNGFRTGVIGGTMPDVLAKFLNLQSEMPETSAQRLITGQNADPRVIRRVIQLNRHEPATIQATDLQEQLHVLINGENGLQGRSYSQVQAVYTLRAEHTTGQRVALQLTPELQHGELRNRYAGSDQGIFLMTPSREREIYDQLKLRTELAAGEVLVVGCLPDSPSSLGRAFHAFDRDGLAEHKLILVRLLQVPSSEILADADPGP